jgi:hypothetical protein
LEKTKINFGLNLSVIMAKIEPVDRPPGKDFGHLNLTIRLKKINSIGYKNKKN